MKNTILKSFFAALVLLTTAVSFTGCYEPSPLYGNWADNAGDTIRFQSDYGFTAKVKTSTGVNSYQGTYVVQGNVLVFEVENPSYNVVTEWDVKGTILNLYWIDVKGEKLKLQLYRTSK